MELKIVKNDDFLMLCGLAAAMYKSINPDINQFQAINTLVHMINTQPSCICFGLYNEYELVGFSFGYEGGVGVFYFAGLYVLREYRMTEWVEKLIDFSFEVIKEKEYQSWEVDATNENIASIMVKYKAEPMHIRYRKDL